MNITQISIERSTLIVVVFILFLFLGTISFFQLNYELVPRFFPPVLTIITTYPGASPQEVERAITIPVEDAIASVEKISTIRSTSQENVSLVKLDLTSEAKVDEVLQNVQRKLTSINRTLPSDADPPTVLTFDFDDLPIIRLGVFTNLPEGEGFTLIKDRIQPALSRVTGVATVDILGGREPIVHIGIHADKLKDYEISLLQVTQAIQRSNLEVPTGNLLSKEGQIQVRLSGKFQSIDELRELVISPTRFGSVIQLKDIATIEEGLSAPEVITMVNGEPAIGLAIQKQTDANAVEMSRLVQEELNELSSIFKEEGLRFEVAQDTSKFTVEAANAVFTDLILAVILVSLFMLLFLHSLRNSLIVLISIPTSIISTFLVMYLLDYSLNLMSLLGLSLAIGILVDDSIVVIENIYRHLEMGKSRIQAAYEGRMEIGFTALSITLIDVVVFLPLALTRGLASDLLRQFCIVIVVSTLMSLFVSFTLVPLLFSRFGKLEVLGTSNPAYHLIHAFESGISQLNRMISRLLEKAFSYPSVTLMLAGLLLAGAIYLIPGGWIGTQFLDTGDRGQMVLNMELPREATLDQTHFSARQVESYLLSQKEVTGVFTTIGINSSARTSQKRAYLAEFNVSLVPKTERDISTSLLARKIKVYLTEHFATADIVPIEINMLGFTQAAPIQVILKGASLDNLLIWAEVIQKEIGKVKGTAEIFTSVVQGNPELQITVDREKMARLGISMGMVGATLQTALRGNSQNRLDIDGQSRKAFIRLSPEDREKPADIQQLGVLNQQGQWIPLSQFVILKEAVGPTQLDRRDRTVSLTVGAQVIGRPKGTVGREIEAQLNPLDIPEDIDVSFGGDIQRQQDAFGTMIFAFLASIFLVYLVMVALYDNYVYPFVVLFSIPLAIIGAFLALALVRQTLNIFTIMGLLMLVGLVGKNAILVVDFANQLKASGMKTRKALIEATKLRFRPILMTNLSMVIGLLPIALATGAGAEWKNGLAWALIGGLSSSMLLSLIVVPVVFDILDRVLERWGMTQKTSFKVSVPIQNGSREH